MKDGQLASKIVEQRSFARLLSSVHYSVQEKTKSNYKEWTRYITNMVKF